MKSDTQESMVNPLDRAGGFSIDISFLYI